MVEIIKYDGTRFMTESDVDREFLGHCVILVGDSNEVEGYLVASAKGDRDAYKAISEYAFSVGANFVRSGGGYWIVSGSDKRGDMMIGLYGCASRE